MGAAVDTLRIYERLVKANLSERAAKEIAEIFKDTIDEQLATKADLAVLKADLEATIAKSKTETVKWVAGMLAAQAAVIAALVKLL